MIKKLFLKEFRLQQSAIYFASAVFMLSIILTVLMLQATSGPYTGQNNYVDTLGYFYGLIIVPCMLFFTPLFIGATMIAEERRLGMWEWQLSLPCPRFWQLVVKLSFALAMILLLTWLIQPLMNALMWLAVRNRPSDWLPSNSIQACRNYFMLATMTMMCGAFASSLVTDPYKAFWSGMAIAFFIFMGIVGYIAFWRYLQYISYIRDYVRWTDVNLNQITFTHFNYVFWAIFAVMARNIYYHFHFEEKSWRRILFDVIAFALLVGLVLVASIVIGWIFLYLPPSSQMDVQFR